MKDSILERYKENPHFNSFWMLLFKIDKRKRFKLTLEIFRDIFKICPRVQGQDFDALPTDEEIIQLDLDKLFVSPEQQNLEQRGVVIRILLRCIDQREGKDDSLGKLKGIDLLSEVELSEEAQYDESRLKSLRDFHKTHPSSSGTVTKTAPSAAKINPSITNERTGGNDKDDSNDDHDSSGEDSDQENDSDDDKTQSNNENDSIPSKKPDENESGSEFDQEYNEEDIEDDKEEVNHEFVKTPSNDSDDEDETKCQRIKNTFSGCLG
ncbi:hypothetical protein Tco_1107756 [Tanacetum coccineum]